LCFPGRGRGRQQDQGAIVSDIDGEAVVCGDDGLSDFNGLHSRRHDDEVQFYAFDVLALEGEDLRALPLHMRKTNLARLLARRPEGMFVSEFERGDRPGPVRCPTLSRACYAVDTRA
jgi:hypothetical protein